MGNESAGVIRTGGCQCGKIRFEARALLDNPHVCHCRMCQKATGNFFAPLVGVPNEALTWTAGKPATFSSSEGVERGFCPDCGTPLFFRRVKGGHSSLNIPAFDDPGSIALVFEYGVESRLPQIAQLGHLPEYVSELENPEEARLAALTNRQR